MVCHCHCHCAGYAASAEGRDQWWSNGPLGPQRDWTQPWPCDRVGRDPYVWNCCDDFRCDLDTAAVNSLYYTTVFVLMYLWLVPSFSWLVLWVLDMLFPLSRHCRAHCPSPVLSLSLSLILLTPSKPLFIFPPLYSQHPPLSSLDVTRCNKI